LTVITVSNQTFQQLDDLSKDTLFAMMRNLPSPLPAGRPVVAATNNTKKSKKSKKCEKKSHAYIGDCGIETDCCEHDTTVGSAVDERERCNESTNERNAREGMIHSLIRLSLSTND
jgi:hypothetical protein